MQIAQWWMFQYITAPGFDLNTWCIMENWIPCSKMVPYLFLWKLLTRHVLGQSAWCDGPQVAILCVATRPKSLQPNCSIIVYTEDYNDVMLKSFISVTEQLINYPPKPLFHVDWGGLHTDPAESLNVNSDNLSQFIKSLTMPNATLTPHFSKNIFGFHQRLRLS